MQVVREVWRGGGIMGDTNASQGVLWPSVGSEIKWTRSLGSERGIGATVSRRYPPGRAEDRSLLVVLHVVIGFRLGFLLTLLVLFWTPRVQFLVRGRNVGILGERVCEVIWERLIILKQPEPSDRWVKNAIIIIAGPDDPPQ